MGFYLDELAGSTVETLEKSTRLLIKIADTILSNPAVSKYRQVNLSKPAIMEHVVQVSGAFDALIAMGFVEESGTEYLRLPSNASLDNLRKVRDELAALASARRRITSDTSHRQSLTTLSAPTASESAFRAKMESAFQSVLIYENPSLRSKARSVIPYDRLLRRAQEKTARIAQLAADLPTSETPLDVRDILLIELMNWFKHEFFKWTDRPPCGSCGGSTSGIGSGEPTADEQKWLAHQTELYSCSSCRAVVRFPRYNHPEMLLKTREGRCGEWANCFTLLCRALDYEARYVLDWTDHVWTEVFSETQQRWISCDPGENAFDKPLVYESGWGKKLTYIMAFSKDDIADVTWRYSSRHADLCSRRTEVREVWLADVLCSMRLSRQSSMSPDQRRLHQKRLVKELCELLTAKAASSDEKVGRQTGSLAWRVARGEAGAERAGQHTFRLSDDNVKDKLLHVRYSCVLDRYEVKASQASTETYIIGWQNGIYEHKSMFRKVEHDWNMVYLAREPGASFGQVTWRIDLYDRSLQVRRVTVAVRSNVFENGVVNWSLCGNRGTDGDAGICVPVRGNGELCSFMDFEGCSSLLLTAKVEGSQGDHAWQHAQLFRQSLGTQTSFELDLVVELE